MAERIIKKSLAGRQDILFGNGQVSQVRAGGLYPINKVSMVWACTTHAELLTLDTSQFTQATVNYQGAVTHWGWTGSHWYCQETDLTLVGSFEAGFTYTAANQVGCTASDIYSWSGSLPHITLPRTNPAIESEYAPRTNAVLRRELASDAGAALIGGLPFVSPLHLGATPGASVDATASIKSAITKSISTGWPLDLRGGP